MAWGCASLNYGPWVAIKAALDFGFECDWFSLHSAQDVVLHSREVTKAFLLKYRGRTEFYRSIRVDPRRTDLIWVSGEGCRSNLWLSELKVGLRAVFPQWTKWTAAYLGQGFQWWTISQNAVKAILKYISRNPDFVRRIGFVRFTDESFVATILGQVGLSVSNPCYIRSIDWPENSSHPCYLNRTLVELGWQRFALFARKIRLIDNDLAVFVENHTLQQGPSLPANLIVPLNTTMCGIHG
jgi:hypothetical protein